MSENNSPVSVVFDAQRSAVEGTHDVVARGVEMQQNLNDQMLEAVDPARDVTERSNDLVRTGFEAYFDAIEAASPTDRDVVADLRDTVDDQLDTLEDSQTDAFDALEENLEDGSEIGRASCRERVLRLV